MTFSRIFLCAALLMSLMACSEYPQNLGLKGTSDTAAFNGAKNGYVEKGWSPGDKTSWEMQLKARAQLQK